MKKLVLLFTFLFLFNSVAFATDSKYISYTSEVSNFNTKRLKMYQKRSFTVTNKSSIPIKIKWSQLYNNIEVQSLFDASAYSTTAGANCVAFFSGMTIIGIPFGIYKSTEMVKNKNIKLLNEINSYKSQGNPNFDTIVNPQESFKLNLIENITQLEPAHIKVRFTDKNDKFLEEVDIK